MENVTDMLMFLLVISSSDAPVCNFFGYITSLRPAKKHYEKVWEKICKCYNPCKVERLDSFFSYSALSKDIQGVLSSGETDRIMKRFRWALDINEFYNVENQYKKSRYRNFTQSVNRLQGFYDKIISKTIVNLLNVRRDNVIAVKGQIMFNFNEVHKQANRIALMNAEILNAQMCIIDKGYVNTRASYALKLIKLLAESHEGFTNSVIIKLMFMSGAVKNYIREVLHVLLLGELHGRYEIINNGLLHLHTLKESFLNGTLLENNLTDCVLNLKYVQEIDPQVIIPKETLKMAVSRLNEIQRKGNYTFYILNDISTHLQTFGNISSTVMTTNTLSAHIYREAIITAAAYSNTCTEYLISLGDIDREMIKWPTQQLALMRDKAAEKKKECDYQLSDHMNELRMIYKSLTDFKLGFKEYRRIVPVLNQYLMYFNVSKFKIAKMFNSRNSRDVHSSMQQLKELITSLAENSGSLDKAIECYKTLYAQIFQNKAVFNSFELKGESMEVSEKFRNFLLNKTMKSLNALSVLRVTSSLHDNHLLLVHEIQKDAMKFANQAVIDVNFYRRNFIFLSIFFSEISYTITEQQVDFGIYNLISDIGGTMGLLIGGSIVSIFEFLDFVICLVVSLLKWSPYGNQ